MNTIRKCPICKLPHVSYGHILGHMAKGKTSEAKARASIANGKRGGRPKSPTLTLK